MRDRYLEDTRARHEIMTYCDRCHCELGEMSGMSLPQLRRDVAECEGEMCPDCQEEYLKEQEEVWHS